MHEEKYVSWQLTFTLGFCQLQTYKNNGNR